MSRLDSVGESFKHWLNPNQGPYQLTKDWPLADFKVAVSIAVGYLVSIVVLSAIMSLKKEPISTKGIQQLYNFIQIILSGWMSLEIARQMYRAGYGFCNNPYDPYNKEIASVLWVFYLSKVFDLLDTLWIVLGKKWNQLSFLHVYHHSSMIFLMWVAINIGYDGDISLVILLNSTVHTVMYYYYLLASLKIHVWWKSLLTLMQIVQFVCMNSQGLYAYNTAEDTTYPKKLVYSYLFYTISLFTLFVNFAVRNYLLRENLRKKKMV